MIMNFSEYLRLRLKEKGMTVKTFASRIGISETAASGYVNGRYFPKVSKMQAIANVLETDLDSVYDMVQAEKANE